MYVLVAWVVFKKGARIMESKKNMHCWNYNDCGHGKDSLCPAVDEKAGRECWLVAKTICGGNVHGKHTERIKSCEGCSFYIYIHASLSKSPLEQQSYKDTRRVDILRSNLSRR